MNDICKYPHSSRNTGEEGKEICKSKLNGSLDHQFCDAKTKQNRKENNAHLKPQWFPLPKYNLQRLGLSASITEVGGTHETLPFPKTMGAEPEFFSVL